MSSKANVLESIPVLPLISYFSFKRICYFYNIILNSITLDPVVCIPCTYLLDGAGKPLEVIAVSLPVEQFLDKLQRTIQVYVYPLIIWLVRR